MKYKVHAHERLVCNMKEWIPIMAKIEVISAIIESGRKMTIGVKCEINIRKRSK